MLGAAALFLISAYPAFLLVMRYASLPILIAVARFVLVEGPHRLEAAKALGEETIVAILVDARKR
jgi:hypothetical protein